MSIKIIPIENIDKHKWNRFCLNSDQAWFTHTTHWLEYTMNMSFSNNSTNHSYGVFDDTGLVAIVPLIEEDVLGEEIREISMAGFPTPYPVLRNDILPNYRMKIEKLIFDNILSIDKIEYFNFYIPPLINNVLKSVIITNSLTKFGFHDTSISTYVLSLNKTSDIILRKMRKGHKSDINYALKKNYTIEIINSKNFSQSLFDKYEEIHFLAAKRKTRPEKSWKIMASWINNDLSFLALSKYYDKYISAAFVNVFNNKAYYQSGATLPEYQTKRGLNHFLQWEVINYLLMSNYKFYELGWVWNNIVSQEVADKKMQNISRFKSGFGAEEFPLFRGEYFQNKPFMIETYQNRINKYWKKS